LLHREGPESQQTQGKVAVKLSVNVVVSRFAILEPVLELAEKAFPTRNKDDAA
jgi:hypothetical protein